MTATLELPIDNPAEATASHPTSEEEHRIAKPRQPAGTTEPEPTAKADARLRPVGVDRVILTGFMGCGKTTTGRELAAQLGWQFLDLDSEIERREGASVAEIFAERGEAYFRHAESAALVAVLGQREVVLALGGGAPEQLGNRLLLEQTPRTAVVYLSAPLPELVARCQREDALAGHALRPLLGEADLRFHSRQPLYERIATHPVATAGLSLPAVVELVLQQLSQGSRRPGSVRAAS